MVLGIGGAWVVSDLIGMTGVLAGIAVLLAIASSAQAGIFFDWYPAHEAAPGEMGTGAYTFSSTIRSSATRWSMFYSIGSRLGDASE